MNTTNLLKKFRNTRVSGSKQFLSKLIFKEFTEKPERATELRQLSVMLDLPTFNVQDN
ncbi:hypothetical protein [Paenimyroides ceti]